MDTIDRLVLPEFIVLENLCPKTITDFFGIPRAGVSIDFELGGGVYRSFLV